MTENLKLRAALAALEEVRPGMALGLGTGSTVAPFIRALGVRVRDGLAVSAVSTSVRSSLLAREAGVPLTTFAQIKTLDLTVDGADEVSPELDLVKGLGGALVREKIVARVSRRRVIVVDETKLVDRLGVRVPIPVEVLPFAADLVAHQLGRIGGAASLRPGEDGAPFVSDNGNYVLDWRFGPVSDPAALERELKLLPGVVDSGIFAGLADRVIVAAASGLRVLDRGAAPEDEGA